MKCNECDNEMVFKATDIDSCWGDYKVTVKGLDAYVCPKCGNILLPAKTVKILEDIARGYAEAEKYIRHEVCEELKERIEDLIEASFDNEEDEFSTITIWGLKKVLDQIEKGEKNE